MISFPAALFILVIEWAHSKGKGNWPSFLLGAMFGTLTVSFLGPIVSSIIDFAASVGSSIGGSIGG